MQKADKILFIILLTIINIGDVSAQYILPTFSHNVNIFFNSDSLYHNFVIPKFPRIDDSFYSNNTDCGIYFFCSVIVDTNNSVKNIDIYPIKGMGNSIEENSELWLEMVDSIRAASKQWIFKSFYYPIDQLNDSPKSKEYMLSINNGKANAKQRPFGGIQYHYILLKYSYGFWLSTPNLLYMMSIGGQVPK